MATDARISTALPQHPKCKKLMRRLGPAGPWALVCLIIWTAANRPNGDLSGMSDEDIELAVDWSGDDGAFVVAMVGVGLLDGEPMARTVHDWAEHNPWAAGADMRSAKARWNAAKRHHGIADADRLVPEYAAIRNASSTDAAEGNKERSNAPSPSPPPSHSPSVSFPPPEPTPIPDVGAADAADASNKRGTRLPIDWQLPKSWGDWALQTFPNWTADGVRMEGERFADHWRSKVGRDATKADWEATWRNWCRSDIAQRTHAPQRASQGSRPPSITDAERSAIVAANTEVAKRMLLGDGPEEDVFDLAPMGISHEES